MHHLIHRARTHTHAHIHIVWKKPRKKKNGVVFPTNGENDALSSSGRGRFLGRERHNQLSEKDDIYNGFIFFGERKNKSKIE